MKHDKHLQQIPLNAKEVALGWINLIAEEDAKASLQAINAKTHENFIKKLEWS